jgi:hypothetical protein
MEAPSVYELLPVRLRKEPCFCQGKKPGSRPSKKPGSRTSKKLGYRTSNPGTFMFVRLEGFLSTFVSIARGLYQPKVPPAQNACQMYVSGNLKSSYVDIS